MTPCDRLGNRGLGISSRAQGLMTGDTQRPAWSPDSPGSDPQGVPELPFTFFHLFLHSFGKYLLGTV